MSPCTHTLMQNVQFKSPRRKSRTRLSVSGISLCPDAMKELHEHMILHKTRDISHHQALSRDISYKRNK